jgi:hypothetical protein
MSPGILRLAEPRFLARPGQRDFKFFLKSQAADLSHDEDVDKLVELCFSRKEFPGLEGAFWRFGGIKAAEDAALQKSIAEKVKESDRSLGSICRIIIEEVTRFSGYDRACVKFAVDVEHIPKLMEWFPGCKVIHITRDPRAVAMSKSNDPSGSALRILEHPRLAWLIRKLAIWHVIAQYRQSSQLHAHYRKWESYRLFRYEDLLAEPERTLRDLCGFAEIEFVPEMLDPRKGQHDHQPSSLTGKRQKSFDPAAAIRWKSVISRIDNWLISTFTLGSMRRLGYNPATHPIFRRTEAPSPKGLPSGYSSV